MKKTSWLLSVILVLTLALTGCGGGNSGSINSEVTPEAQPQDSSTAYVDETTPSQENTATGGTIIMATEAGFKPYEYREGQEIVGVDVEIAKEIAAALGKELLIEDMAFDAVIPAVKSGKADFGAAGISIRPDRQEQVDFAIEYATSKQIIMVKKDSPIKGAEDLKGKTVGVQLVTTGEDLVILDNELMTDTYAFCVQKGNTELLNTMNEVMQKLMDEGKISEFTKTHSA